MFPCPDCHLDLSRLTARANVWECPTCGGRAADLSGLRRTHVGAFVRQLRMMALRASPISRRACPGCAKPMAEVPTISATAAGAPLMLDVCPRCEIVWFDRREHEAWLAAPAAAAANLPFETRQALDRSGVSEQLARTAALREAAAEHLAVEEMDGFIERTAAHDLRWQHFIWLVFGLPVEVEPPPLRSRPWATWSLAAVITLASLCAFAFGDRAVDALGLISADVWRHHGLTFMTSFFLHGSLLHLLGNLYFLVVFGDDVEDRRGRAGYLVLIALSAVTGDLLHTAIHADSTVPSIGASGGISGVMAFYALRFARRRLRVVLGVPSARHSWLRYGLMFDMRASAAMALWVLVQLAGAGLQVGADVRDGVAYLAHLGGAAMGLVFWLGDRAYSMSH